MMLRAVQLASFLDCYNHMIYQVHLSSQYLGCHKKQLFDTTPWYYNIPPMLYKTDNKM